MKLGVVIDPIETLDPKKDSTLAMLEEANRRNWEVHVFELKDLGLRDGKAYARSLVLSSFDRILMRKDPPVDMDYIYATHILDRAQTCVVNRPQSLRDCNEKLFTTWFPECCPPTLVSRNLQDIRDFLQVHADIVCKPLHGMGGRGVFRLVYGDLNTSSILESYQGHYIMAQKFIADIASGDKRILMIDGKPVPYALARIPAKGELRGNLAAGGMGVGVGLSQRDRWICERVGPVLKEKGLLFVGLDVIGDYLTEINVTSPTCIRQLDALYHMNISAQFLDVLEGLT